MPGTVMAPLPSPQAPSPRSSALRPISAQPESVLSSAAGISSNNSHWPAGSSAYPTQLSLVLRAIGGSSRRRTAQHLSLMRRAYGHHRTRLPTSTLAQSGNWARQLMTRSLLSLSHIAPASPVPVFWCDGPRRRNSHYCFRLPKADCSPREHRSNATKTNARVITHSLSLSETLRGIQRVQAQASPRNDFEIPSTRRR